MHEQEKAQAEEASCFMKKEIKYLREEIDFLKEIYREERSELLAQMKNQHIQFDMDVVKADIFVALQDIRREYEHKMSEVSTIAFKKAREEVHNCRQQMSEPLDKAREENRQLRQEVKDLKKQLNHMQTRSSTEPDGSINVSILDMKEEIIKCEEQYTELLRNNVSFDMEVQYYRSLLEKVETRTRTDQPKTQDNTPSNMSNGSPTLTPSLPPKPDVPPQGKKK